MNMYRYRLPDTQGNPVEYESTNNSLIIIGANGSGKSKLGAWMEQQDMEKVHRVSAQRSLNFGEYIKLKSYEQAKNLLLYGNEKAENSKGHRWPWDGKNYKFTTTLINDYEDVLSALIAKKNKEHDEFIIWCKDQKELKKPHCETPYTDIDVFNEIWNSVFPHRQVFFDDGKVTAVYVREKKRIEYKGNEMSDGERVALYLIAQCLCIPENKIIIIDEPELHLHRSIMNRLWTAIEDRRQDCLFIYITHDTQFAANHRQAEKIWVKGFDGQNWELEQIKNSILPEKLLLDILGNRKPVLFVEGTTESYDTKLYSEIYKDYYVVACGGCSNVIIQTKAMNANEQLHHLQAYGIIDRDYRTDNEIQSLKEHGIFALKVAEVENLFLIEEILKIVNEHQGFNDNSKVDKVKTYIIDERYTKQINSQICEAVVSEIKFLLSTFDISSKDETTAKQTLEEAYKSINFDNIKSEKETIFNNIAETTCYKDVLKVFNCKNLSQSIGHFFNLDNKDYCNLVIRLIKGQKSQLIIDAITNYLPTEIPAKLIK